MNDCERHGFAAVVDRELRRFVSRPLYVVLTVLLPLVSFAVLVPLFSAAVPRKLPIAVCDKDFSSLSRRLTRMLDASPTLKVAYKITDPEQGRRLITTGDAYAVVVIPERMERDAFAGRAPNIVGYYNNQYLITAGNVSRDILTAVSTLSAGLNLKTRQKRGESAAAAMAHLAPVQVDHHILFNPYTNYAYYLMTCLLPNMMQIFILITTVFVIGVELREGTARAWLECAGGSVVKAVAGKLLLYTVIFLAMGCCIGMILFRYLGAPMQGDLRTIGLGYVLFVLSYESLGLLIVALLSNLRMGLSVAALYSSPAFAFSGVTFPMTGAPLLGKVWAQVLPLTHFLKIMLDQCLRGAPVYVSLHPLAILGLFALLGPMLALPRLKQVMSHEQYWGRV